MVCELAIDPTERPRQWLGFVLLVGLVVIVLVVTPWEFIIRHGEDPGVWSGCLVLISIVLIGPVGIKIVSRGSRASRSPTDNGSGGA